jgi:hypothetical protein
VPADQVRVAYDPGLSTATFTFSAALANANYRAVLAGAGVSDAAGNVMAANHSIDFFALAGDVNRDRAVNGTDFAILAGNFGKSLGMTYATGDLNGDGSVNGSDFATLAGNFGRTVPAPVVTVAGPVMASSVAPTVPIQPTPSTGKTSPKREKVHAPQRPARAAKLHRGAKAGPRGAGRMP